MAIVQVKDATGTVLDWMVAKCEGWELKTGVSAWYGNEPWFELFLGNKPWGNGTYRSVNRCLPRELRYSSDWEKGGPIIERENVALSPLTDGTWNAYVANGTRWVPRNQSGVEVYNWEFKQTGSTPLIAAMRCYVASKLGDTVEVPDELI